jgi:hypothetical protein
MGTSAGLVGHIDVVRVPVADRGFGFTEGNSVYIRVNDLGSPGTLDLVNVDPGTSTPPVTCPGPGHVLPHQQGNYVVHDQPVTDALELEAESVPQPGRGSGERPLRLMAEPMW